MPDSAHGTNLSSATIGGYEVVEIPSSSRGLVDLDALRAHLSDRTAAIMLTNPNTLGLFEEDILEISRLVHEAGALCYYDGANLNAIMGKARPGDMGMDVVHLNLHKTFSTPHGGGGPGAGPVAVTERLEPYLPHALGRLPAGIGRGSAASDYDRPLEHRPGEGLLRQCGRARPRLQLPAAHGRRRPHPGERGRGAQRQLPARPPAARSTRCPYDGPCMHEFVLSAADHGAGARSRHRASASSTSACTPPRCTSR